jgi:hypothetical protein
MKYKATIWFSGLDAGEYGDFASPHLSSTYTVDMM